MATTSPLIEVPKTSLPKDAQRLLDRRQPLPGGHLLAPSAPARIVPPLTLALAAVTSGFVFARGWLGDPSVQLRWIFGVLALLCLLAGTIPAQRALQAILQRLALCRGRSRRGLHVAPDSLMLWDGQKASWIPRTAVDRVRFSVRGQSKTRRRTTVVDFRSEEGQIATIQVGMIPAPLLGESTQSTLYWELSRWVETGTIQPPSSATPRIFDSAKPWVRNVCLGHLVLAIVGIAALLILFTTAQLFGRQPGALFGILVGVPAFLGFPAILDLLARRYLIVDSQSGRAVGWGYSLLLGLGALFITTIGGDVVSTLRWQLVAKNGGIATLDALEHSAGSPVFYSWADDLRPLGTVIGHHTSRFFLGDNNWIETTYYVTPLVKESDPSAGCVWIGIETSEGRWTTRSEQRLLKQRSGWLVEASGLESSGYRKALREALNASAIEPKSCRRVVFLGSVSRPEAIRRSISHLALLLGLAHGIPLLLLAAWTTIKLDGWYPRTVLGDGE